MQCQNWTNWFHRLISVSQLSSARTVKQAPQPHLTAFTAFTLCSLQFLYLISCVQWSCFCSWWFGFQLDFGYSVFVMFTCLSIRCLANGSPFCISICIWLPCAFFVNNLYIFLRKGYREWLPLIFCMWIVCHCFVVNEGRDYLLFSFLFTEVLAGASVRSSLVLFIVLAFGTEGHPGVSHSSHYIKIYLKYILS